MILHYSFLANRLPPQQPADLHPQVYKNFSTIIIGVLKLPTFKVLYALGLRTALRRAATFI